MSKNSMQSLSVRLQQMQAEDAARLESQTQQRLQEHANGLKMLSIDALREMRAAIARESGAMEATLVAHRSAVEKMVVELRDIHEREAIRMRWILRFPLIVVLLVTTLTGIGIWGWWKYERPWALAPMSNGEVYQVLKGGWTTMCTVRGSQRPCRPIPGGND